MGIVYSLSQRRRPLLLGILILLLHAALWSLVSHQTGASRLPSGLASAALVQTRLLSEAAAPVPDPEPLPAPTPLAPPPLPPPLPALALDAVTDTSAPLADAAAMPDAAQAGAADPAALASTASVSADAETAPASPAPEAPAPAAAALRRYQVALPPPARIALDVVRVDADGTRWSGEAELAWHFNDERYRISFEAGIRVVFARVNLAVLNSEGALAATGFAPVTMTEKRRGRAQTATHFDWQHEQITYSASQQKTPLIAGAQDKASVPLQLTAIARGDPAQLSGDIDIQVAEDRGASIYRFIVLGQEQLDTKLGTLQTVHLARPPQPGVYRSRLDIWLAPAHGWYPVQIQNTEANGAVTTQSVNNIVLMNTEK